MVQNTNSVVYLAPANVGIPLPSFQEKGISDLMPGELDNVTVIATSNYTKNTYWTVMSNIQAYGYAQFTGGVIPIAPEPKNIFKPLVNLSHTFDVPVTLVSLNGPTEEQVSILTAHGFSSFPGRKDTFIGTPPISSLAAIARLQPIDCRNIPGYVPFDAYKAWSFAMKGIQMFSSLSRYAALAEKVNMIVDNSPGASNDPFDGDKGVARLYALGSLKTVEVAGAIKKDEIMIHSEGIMLATAIDDTRTFVGSYVTPQGINLPLIDGIFFPYFDGLCLPDKAVFIHVFSRLFFKGIADSPKSCSQIWSSIRSGYRALAWTPSGRLISHAYFGIQLALQTAAIYSPVVENGRYMGFILQQDGLVIEMHGRQYGARTQVELIQDLAKLDEHRQSLRNIVTLINTPKKDDGTQWYSISDDQISTSSRLRSTMLQLEYGAFSSMNFEQDLMTEVEKLAYGDRFDVPSGSMILDALRYIQTGDFSVIAKYPSYPKFLLSKDRVHTAFSIFGPRIPSLSYGDQKNSQKFPMPSDLAAQDPNVTKSENGKAPLSMLPFQVVPYVKGVSQWIQLFKSGTIMIPHPRKKKQEFTDSSMIGLRITGDPMFSEVYRVVKQISAETRKARQDGKRGRDDDTERSTVKRVKKVHVEQADDL